MTLPVELQDLLMQVLVAVVSLVVAAIGFYGRLYLKKLELQLKVKIGADQYAWLTTFITNAVHSASQNPLLKDFTGPALKEWVDAQATTFIHDNDLPFSEKDVDVLIEAAVKWMKYEFSEPVYVLPE